MLTYLERSSPILAATFHKLFSSSHGPAPNQRHPTSGNPVDKWRKISPSRHLFQLIFYLNLDLGTFPPVPNSKHSPSILFYETVRFLPPFYRLPTSPFRQVGYLNFHVVEGNFAAPSTNPKRESSRSACTVDNLPSLLSAHFVPSGTYRELAGQIAGMAHRSENGESTMPNARAGHLKPLLKKWVLLLTLISFLCNSSNLLCISKPIFPIFHTYHLPFLLQTSTPLLSATNLSNLCSHSQISTYPILVVSIFTLLNSTREKEKRKIREEEILVKTTCK